MSLNFYKITPIDTLFFRDGRPYNLGESNQNDVESMFPPTPFTVVGGLRAAIAKNLGWNGKGTWGNVNQITDKIGNHNNLGSINFYGPFIMIENETNKSNEILYPLPKNIRLKIKKSEETEKKYIKSYEVKKIKPTNKITSDLGTIDFPMEPENNEDSDSKYIYINGYVNKKDLETLLSEDNPTNKINIYTNDNIFENEYTVGIKRNASKLTVEEGNLFSRQFVRMKSKVHFVIGCDGCEELSTKIDRSLIMLGGESKGAYVQKIDNIELPNVKVNYDSKFIVYFATPTRLDGISLNGEIKEIGNAKLVSGCIDKPVMIGGWDFNEGPQELKSFIPQGTVFFMEKEGNDTIDNLNNKKIGDSSNFGFGHILIGKW
ncbi:MAG: type III-B CRISPR module-associated protein Cmr3 [Thermoplasmata archaeon]